VLRRTVVGDTITAGAPVLDCAAMLRTPDSRYLRPSQLLERSMADRSASGVGSVDYAE
jgi:hypothetical protein